MPRVFLRTALVLAGAAGGLLVACSDDAESGGSDVPDNVHCDITTATAYCTCTQQDTGTFDGLESVPMCDEHPDGEAWECCYDADSEGYASYCSCAVWGCVRSGDSCMCGYDVRPEPGDVRVASCDGAVCARWVNPPDPSCQCSDDPNDVLGGDETVPSCTEPPTRCAGGSRSASSCKGARWRPPSPGSGECIRSGNACGPAGQALAACCSGYCGENGTCES